MMAFVFGNSQFRIASILANIALDIKWYSARFEFSKTELLSPFEYLFYTGLGFEYYC
jgi:hypothetical protein